MLREFNFAGMDEPFTLALSPRSNFGLSQPSAPLEPRARFDSWSASLQTSPQVVSAASRAIALELGRKIFGGTVNEELVTDEESDRLYVVVSVETRGQPNEVIEKELLWHEQLEQLIGTDEFFFRLSIRSVR